MVAKGVGEAAEGRLQRPPLCRSLPHHTPAPRANELVYIPKQLMMVLAEHQVKRWSLHACEVREEGD